jgi:membrane-anchored protein YejM (alkaline phosphatase superfamily)
MNVILLLCDALRFDRVNASKMPNIIKWAKKGVTFNLCMACDVYTKACVHYILSGEADPVNLDETKRKFEPETSFIHILNSNRVSTALIHSNLALDIFKRVFGYECDVYRELKGNLAATMKKRFRRTILWKSLRWLKKKTVGFDLGYRSAELILNYADAWIKEQKKQFFVWVHLMDTHIPYWPIEYETIVSNEELEELNQKIRDSVHKGYKIKPEEREKITLLYDAEVQYLDKCLNDFIEKQDKEDLIIITSDHGEELGDYGYYSHQSAKHGIIPQLVHVPLIFVNGGVKSAVINKPVSHLDLGSTILDFMGYKHSLGLGKSLKFLII